MKHTNPNCLRGKSVQLALPLIERPPRLDDFASSQRKHHDGATCPPAVCMREHTARQSCGFGKTAKPAIDDGFEENHQTLPSHASAPCIRIGAPRSRPASPVHRRSYTAVAIPPLRLPNPHGRPTPSFASSPSEGFFLIPSRSSSSTSSPSEGLQSIGGLELVDNHSSHQESNEAGPLALNLPLDECIVNTINL
jgi:ribosomal protein S27AE